MDLVTGLEAAAEVTITPEEFVRIWNSSVNIPEVVNRTGWSRQRVYGRVRHYRKHGVPMKAMPNAKAMGAVDWDRLKDVGEQALLQAEKKR